MKKEPIKKSGIKRTRTVSFQCGEGIEIIVEVGMYFKPYQLLKKSHNLSWYMSKHLPGLPICFITFENSGVYR